MNTFLSLVVLAATTTSNGEGETAPSMFQQNPLLTALPFVLFLVAMWFLLIEGPRKKQERARTSMLDTIQKGDKVVSIGGIHGKVAKVDRENQVVTVQVAKGVEMEFNQAAISQVARSKGGES